MAQSVLSCTFRTTGATMPRARLPDIGVCGIVGMALRAVSPLSAAIHALKEATWVLSPEFGRREVACRVTCAACSISTRARLMVIQMLRTRPDFEIVATIISPVTIPMMDKFTWLKAATENLLGNDSMFSLALVRTTPEDNVALWIDALVMLRFSF